METDASRRRFIELASAGTALSLAGCSGLTGSAETPTEDASALTDDGTPTVAVALRADQAKLQQRQQSIKSELDAGNISDSEAQQRVKSAREELLSEAIDAFSQRTNSNDALTVDGTVEQYGLLLVSGSATALIEALSFAEVTAIVPEATFSTAKSQANMQTKTPTPSN